MQFSSRLAALRAATLSKKGLWHRCFPLNFAKLLRIPFLKEHPWWLLMLFWCLCLLTWKYFTHCPLFLHYWLWRSKYRLWKRNHSKLNWKGFIWKVIYSKKSWYSLRAFSTSRQETLGTANSNQNLLFFVWYKENNFLRQIQIFLKSLPTRFGQIMSVIKPFRILIIKI